jgi:hypothetical protein
MEETPKAKKHNELVNKTQLKELASKNLCEMGIDYFEAMNKKVESLTKEACMRAKNNGRKRVRDIDL